MQRRQHSTKPHVHQQSPSLLTIWPSPKKLLKLLFFLFLERGTNHKIEGKASSKGFDKVWAWKYRAEKKTAKIRIFTKPSFSLVKQQNSICLFCFSSHSVGRALLYSCAFWLWSCWYNASIHTALLGLLFIPYLLHTRNWLWFFGCLYSLHLLSFDNSIR